MKTLISLALIALFTTATFAQNSTEEKAISTAKEKPKTHDCYMMKGGVLMHCMGDKTEAQKKEVVLKNGTVISPTGDVKMKDGKNSKLENGQCISLTGTVGDYVKMHSSNKAENEPPPRLKADDETKTIMEK